MRLLKSSLLAGIFWGIAGLCSLFAQVQLDRISISERSDGNGYVVRYHLSEMVDSFEVIQPEVNRIQMRLFSTEIDTIGFIHPEVNNEVTRVELIRLEDGMGIDITTAQGSYFLADAYPDQNLHDLLLSLEYSTQAQVEKLANNTGTYTWLGFSDGEESEEPMEETASETRTVQPAQHPPLSVKFGIAAGGGISNIAGAGYNSQTREKIGMGFTATLTLPYMLANSIHTSIETGIFYIQKGFQNPSELFDAKTVALDYIEVPVMGRFSYNFTDMIVPYASVGFYTAFISNAESIEYNGDRNDLDKVTKVTDVGGILGLGTDVRFGNTTVNFQLRYAAGVTGVFKNEYSDNEKNYYLYALMGIRF